MPRRKRKSRRLQKSKEYTAQYTKRYDWVNLLRSMAPGESKDVPIGKRCQLASNPPLVAAKRLGIRIRTHCRECAAPDDVPAFLRDHSHHRESVLTITRLADPIAIP